MSTFDGRIKEYGLISIDKFKLNGYSKYYFLSHVHSDHLDGLQDERFNKKIYCTEQSAKLLPLITHSRTKRPLYAHLKDLLVPIPYNKRYTMEDPKYGEFHVTFLPANHCLGSSIILIECKRSGTIVYAQDIRAEEDFVKRELGALLEHRIQNLYMDTTCCYDRKMNFISKKKSCELLVNKIKSFEEYHHVYMDFWQLGYEEAWGAVFKNFKKKVHVSEERYTLFCTTDPRYENILTTDASSTRFHSCNWEGDCTKHGKYTIAFHPMPTVNQEINAYVDKKSVTLLRSDLPYKADLKLQMILPFSTHSSCSEIAAFHKYVKPKLLTPCVAHGGWETMDNMRRLLVSLGCNVGDVQFSGEETTYSSCGSSKRQKVASQPYSLAYSKTLSDVETWSPDALAPTPRYSSHRSSLADTTNTSSLLQRSASQNANQESGPVETIKSMTPQEEASPPLVLTSQYTLPEIVEPDQDDPDCIVISSDDEDEYNKPLLTKSLFRQFKRNLQKCAYVRKDQEQITTEA